VMLVLIDIRHDLSPPKPGVCDWRALPVRAQHPLSAFNLVLSVLSQGRTPPRTKKADTIGVSLN
jgi:hypothetical protein